MSSCEPSTCSSEVDDFVDIAFNEEDLAFGCGEPVSKTESNLTLSDANNEASFDASWPDNSININGDKCCDASGEITTNNGHDENLCNVGNNDSSKDHQELPDCVVAVTRTNGMVSLILDPADQPAENSFGKTENADHISFNPEPDSQEAPAVVKVELPLVVDVLSDRTVREAEVFPSPEAKTGVPLLHIPNSPDLGSGTGKLQFSILPTSSSENLPHSSVSPGNSPSVFSITPETRSSEFADVSLDDVQLRTPRDNVSASRLSTKKPEASDTVGNRSSKFDDAIVEFILDDDDDDDDNDETRDGDRPVSPSNSHRLSSAMANTGTTFRSPSTDAVDIVSDKTGGQLDMSGFEEINLQSSGSTIDKSDAGSEQSASKRSGLANFLSRSLMFSRKSSPDAVDAEETTAAPGWKLFGKVPPKQAPEKNPNEISLEYKAKVQHTTKPPSSQESPIHSSIASTPLAVIKTRFFKRSDKEVPSTTALILEQRPDGLPSKDPEEALRHQMMYNEMIEMARKKEQKDLKLRKKQREQQIRYEEQMSNALHIWNKEILPNWDTSKSLKKTQDLWWNGLPPSVRGKVWKLAIGNDLNVTAELYEICLVRAKEKLKILRDGNDKSDTDSVSSLTAESPGNRESSVELIKLDVQRTFPQLCIFQQGGPYHETLQGLLGAYACYRPDVGYVQGMSFLAAVLLLNMDDVDTFMCFANLLNKPCEVALFRLDENLMKAYFETYQMFFKENLPQLFAHFTALNINPDIYIIDWMYTLFAKSLPLDVASRVWDVFCRDGEEFLFRTALGILRMYEDILLRLDFIHLAQFLTRLPENISVLELFGSISHIHMVLDKQRFAQVLSAQRELCSRC